MSAREYTDWLAFEIVCGPLLLHERIDHAAAKVSHALTRIFVKEPPAYEEFLPAWGRATEAKDEQTPDQMIALVRSFQRRKRRKAG